MKTFAVAFAVILASVSALPNLQVEKAIRSGQERLVTDQIVSAIEDISQAIVDAGLDPLIIDHDEIDYALPVPSIFNLRAHVAGFLFQGLSDIRVYQINLNLITLRMTFNMGMPQIILNTVSSAFDANLFGKNINCQYSGKLAFEDIRVIGNIRVSVGIISGISIRDIDLQFRLRDIESQLNLRCQGTDYTNSLNKFLGDTIPETLTSFEKDINELLTIVAKDVIEAML